MDRIRRIRSWIYDYGCLDTPARDRTGDQSQTLGTRLGQQRLRRPAIFGKLIMPSAADFDYDYYLKELASGEKLPHVAGMQPAAD